MKTIILSFYELEGGGRGIITECHALFLQKESFLGKRRHSSPPPPMMMPGPHFSIERPNAPSRGTSLWV